jgi:hypothetical protein
MQNGSSELAYNSGYFGHLFYLFQEKNFTLGRDFLHFFTQNTKSAIQKLKIRKKEFSILVLGSHFLAKNA